MYPTNLTSSSASSSSLSSITTTVTSSTASTSVANKTSAKQLTSPRHYQTKTNQAEWEHRKILNNLINNIHSFNLNLTNSTALKTVSNENERSEINSAISNKTDLNTFVHVGQTQNDLLRIHECIEQIFLNGLRVCKPDVSFNIISN